MISTQHVSACLICGNKDSNVFTTTHAMMHDQTEEWDFRKCAECEMVFLSPRVDQEDLGVYYTDNYLPYRGASAWGAYSKLVEGDQNKIDNKRFKLVQKNVNTDAKTILDIGCGKPSFLKLVQEKSGMKSVGLDFSDKGWKSDRNTFKDLELHIGSVEDVSSIVQADVITMWHYLEHDYNPKQTLETLSQNQKPGTKIIIEVPNHDSYTRKKYGQFWSGYHTPRHTGLYNLETMKSLLESSGWVVENQYTYGTLDPYVLDWMSRMEKAKIDWSQSMEPYFMDYVFGKILRQRYYFDRYLNLGFMTTIARNGA